MTHHSQLEGAVEQSSKRPRSPFSLVAWLLPSRLRLQLAAVVGALFVTVLLVAGAAVWGGQQALGGLRSVYEDRAMALVRLNSIARALDRERTATLATIAAPNKISVPALAKTIAATRSRVKKNWEAYAKRAMPKDERQLATAFDAVKAIEDNGPIRTILAQLRRGQDIEADVTSQREYTPQSHKVSNALESLIGYQVQAAGANYRSARRLSHLSLWLVVIVGGFGLLVGCGLSLVLARRILRTLGGEPARAAAIAGEIARGNLAPDGDSLAAPPGSLLDSMRRMRERLSAAVGQISEASAIIASHSRQIASGNAELSKRTEEQVSSLEHTSSNMEKLAAAVFQNAEHAQEADQLAQRASGVAIEGRQVVSQVVGTMNEINAASTRIADIIGVIDGIAFQTNILALNAAVEAARAGSQGRGFAVVASEVRNLAQRSAAAAREIKQLIADSVDRVSAGTKLVNNAGTTMGDIVAAIQHVTDIMANIASASQQQSVGIEQMNRAITQINEATQQNASLGEEVAAAAETMEDQAANLIRVLQAFTVKGREDRAQLAPRQAAEPEQSGMPRRTESARTAPGRVDALAGSPARPRLISVRAGEPA